MTDTFVRWVQINYTPLEIADLTRQSPNWILWAQAQPIGWENGVAIQPREDVYATVLSMSQAYVVPAPATQDPTPAPAPETTDRTSVWTWLSNVFKKPVWGRFPRITWGLVGVLGLLALVFFVMLRGSGSNGAGVAATPTIQTVGEPTSPSTAPGFVFGNAATQPATTPTPRMSLLFPTQPSGSTQQPDTAQTPTPVSTVDTPIFEPSPIPTDTPVPILTPVPTATVVLPPPAPVFAGTACSLPYPGFQAATTEMAGVDYRFRGIKSNPALYETYLGFKFYEVCFGWSQAQVLMWMEDTSSGNPWDVYVQQVRPFAAYKGSTYVQPENMGPFAITISNDDVKTLLGLADKHQIVLYVTDSLDTVAAENASWQTIGSYIAIPSDGKVLMIRPDSGYTGWVDFSNYTQFYQSEVSQMIILESCETAEMQSYIANRNARRLKTAPGMCLFPFAPRHMWESH
jgi:hypothetical protein